MKIVINKCYGGFSVSKEAAQFMAAKGHEGAIEELANKTRFYGYFCNDDRTNPLLIEAVETLGSKVASGECARIEIVEIPDGIDWEIGEYDGIEHIAQRHQTWY